MRFHDLDGIVYRLIRAYRGERVSADFGERHLGRVADFGDRADSDVAVGDDPARFVPLHHHDRTDLVVAHRLGRLGYGRV